MPHATLTIEIPEGLWIGEVTRAHPDVEVTVLTAIPGEETGVALAELSGPGLASAVADVQAHEDVPEASVLEHRDGWTLLQLETTAPLLLEPARRSGVPVETPFAVEDGEVVWELKTSRDRLSRLGTQLEAVGLSFRLDAVRELADGDSPLSDHQWDLVTTAVEQGYYDTPRTCTQTELAEQLGMAKSTCSETLHRAEEQMVKRFVERHSGPDGDEQRLTVLS